MKINRRDDGEVAIFTLSGAFDQTSIREMEEQLDAAIRRGHTHLVLNFRDVTFISSNGISQLIYTHHRLRDFDGTISVAEPSDFVRTCFTTIGLDHLVPLFATEADAISGAAPATDLRGNVDKRFLGSTEVTFELVDEPGTTAVGSIVGLYKDGPTIRYPETPEEATLDPRELTIGREVRVTFPQPFLDRDRSFTARAKIVLAADLGAWTKGSCKYRLEYTEIADEALAELSKFVADLDLYRKTARPPEAP